MSSRGIETCKEALSANKIHPYTIGEKYLIRTVTHYYTGLLTDVFEHELVLDNAAWIADTGRYTQAIMQGINSGITSEEIDGSDSFYISIDGISWDFIKTKAKKEKEI